MAPGFDSLKAALADRYLIEREIGQGGMATVYLAKDLKHERQVAIKVLKPELSAVIGAERFLAEIKTTANLQHPHILPLFDSGEADGFLFYVMPYIEDETLRDRLDREKQLPVDEAVHVATAVANALDYAHDQGLIHRDIKPANILLSRGEPLVADFGIALAVSAAGGMRLTETGLSLGTPQYMSPEQATGEREVTAKSDVYSLGAVVYEMLVGDPPHTGPTMQAIIGKVVSVEPQPISDVRSTVPVNVDAAVHKALAKVPADRFPRAGQFAEALANPAFTLPTTRRSVLAEPSVSAAGAWRTFGKWVVGLVLLSAGVSAALTWALKPSSAPEVTRFTVPLGRDGEFDNPFRSSLALSPDGRTLVYSLRGYLRVRTLDRVESVRLDGTLGAEEPFFSHDGQWIGFKHQGTLKRISVRGGPLTEIARAELFAGGASWGEDGTIVYSSWSGGLWRVPAAGGVPEQVTTVADDGSEFGHFWPQWLSPNKLVLYTVIGPSTLWEDSRIVVHDLETGDRQVVAEKATFGRYLRTGHVVYAQADGTILALPYDVARREAGAAFAVEQGVRVGASGGGAWFAVSNAGTAAFVRGSEYEATVLWWVDRAGRRVGQLGTPATSGFVRLSPDGSRLATWIRQPTNADIWFVDVATGLPERLTFHPAWEHSPVWSSDGRSIIYLMTIGGGTRIVMRDLENARDAVPLYTSTYHTPPVAWSPDGKWLVFEEDHRIHDDLYVIQVDSVENLIPIATTSAQEHEARFSPDGRGLAYESDESGRPEIYVVSVPDFNNERRQQVTTNGGVRPRWAPSGGELFFQNDGALWVVRVSTTGLFDRLGAPRKLFELPGAQVTPTSHAGSDYDVAQDGTRFLFKVGNEDAPVRQIDVVLNWSETLKERVGN